MVWIIIISSQWIQFFTHHAILWEIKEIRVSVCLPFSSVLAAFTFRRPLTDGHSHPLSLPLPPTKTKKKKMTEAITLFPLSTIIKNKGRGMHYFLQLVTQPTRCADPKLRQDNHNSSMLNQFTKWNRFFPQLKGLCMH